MRTKTFFLVPLILHLLVRDTVSQIGQWSNAYAEAEKILSKLSLAHVVNITSGNDVPGFNQTIWIDGPNGVNGPVGVSGFVSAQTLASSFDRHLVSQQYAVMAHEFLDKGYGQQLGPVTGPLGRSVFDGRLFEGFGSDQYLNGKLFAVAVTAIQQQGLISTGKHFLANEQETNRSDPNFRPISSDRSSSNIDDRTVHEVYLWPWVDGVNAGLGSVMCVMNRVNNTQGCENNHTLTELLKEELNFPGYVIPDASAIVNNTAAVLAGVDNYSSGSFEEVLAQVENGTIPETVVRDHAIRIIATQLNINAGLAKLPDVEATALKSVRRASTPSLIRTVGSQSIVLLKNVDQALPLVQPHFIGVFGADATNMGGGPTPPEDVVNYLGEVYDSHLASGGGSGSTYNPYIVSPLDALSQRASSGAGFDIKYITENAWKLAPAPNATFLTNTGPTIATWAGVSDTCLVFLNAYAKEGTDRKYLADPIQDALVEHVATYCNNTMVIINGAGARLVDAWIEHPNVTAVLNAGLLGEQSGHAIADVLFGDVTPSGRLPYTVAKQASDYNGKICPCCECNYTEGLFIDYRHFDRAGITPRFEFGFGLSYTSFNYTDPTVEKLSNQSISRTAEGPKTLGGYASLFDTLLSASINVKNTGAVAGYEVVQLYVSYPDGSGEPIRQLRGFEKAWVKSGQTVNAKFALQRRDLSVWDVASQKWSLSPGSYTIWFGKSSRLMEGSVAITLL